MRQLKPFDQYVREAQRAPLLLPMPDGEPITIYFPSGRTIRKVGEAQATQDIDGLLLAFFGDEAGRRLSYALDDAPFDVVLSILRDCMTEFGVDLQGNPLGSST